MNAHRLIYALCALIVAMAIAGAACGWLVIHGA